MEKFAEQVTQQLAKDIEKAANYKLAAVLNPALAGLTSSVGGTINDMLGGRAGLSMDIARRFRNSRLF